MVLWVKGLAVAFVIAIVEKVVREEYKWRWESKDSNTFNQHDTFLVSLLNFCAVIVLRYFTQTLVKAFRINDVYTMEGLPLEKL